MFDEKQLDKLKKNGYLYFKLDEVNKEIIKSERDRALIFENVKEIKYRYFRRELHDDDISCHSMSKNDYNLDVSIITPHGDSDWETMLKELGEWSNLQKHTITNSERDLILHDGRCEVNDKASDWNSIRLISNNIFNSCYADNFKADDLRYDVYGRIMFKDMFLDSHTDAYGGVRPCTILLYANEDWKPGDGGELICDGNVLEPTLGNAAILDFTRDIDVRHGVNPILTDFVRRSWTIFVNGKEHN
tara:strand:- start:47 stop:784 length:738 start_codon:yes stop_codon:yes gene_type:complete